MLMAGVTLSALFVLPLHALGDELEAERYGPTIPSRITFYGPGYDARPMGCGGTYWASDPTIAAVGPSRYAAWPCGTELEISGPAGTIRVVRRDSCPGCAADMVDLSDGANELVCGVPRHTCRAEVREVLR